MRLKKTLMASSLAVLSSFAFADNPTSDALRHEAKVCDTGLSIKNCIKNTSPYAVPSEVTINCTSHTIACALGGDDSDASESSVYANRYLLCPRFNDTPTSYGEDYTADEVCDDSGFGSDSSTVFTLYPVIL